MVSSNRKLKTEIDPGGFDLRRDKEGLNHLSA
jgi:hypothetical protein